jgi:hypothetical protein
LCLGFRYAVIFAVLSCISAFTDYYAVFHKVS